MDTPITLARPTHHPGPTQSGSGEATIQTHLAAGSSDHVAAVDCFASALDQHADNGVGHPRLRSHGWQQ